MEEKYINKKILFNDGWEFAKSPLEGFEERNMKYIPVDIPHDWLIYDTLKLYEDSIGWYRKKFTANKENQILLCFDGVYMDSTLYVNGKYIGDWKYGYSSFEHDITNAVVDGENEIILKVVYQSPNSRWYSGAGIYRNVWLKIRDKNHLESNGVYITSRKSKDGWQVEIDTELDVCEEVNIKHTISYKDEIISTFSAAAFPAEKHNKQIAVIASPKLWSTDNPNLYSITTELLKVSHESNSIVKIESITQNIGFREIVFDPQNGLSLNGNRLKLNGVCEHHDLGALGAAFNKTALRRRFEILKEMGVNAVRTAHNMPAPELMELADEMGFLVVSEAFDMWERPKNQYDYGRFFKDWAHADVKSWVKRDRNHPSLLMWSIGNEIYDTHADERGQEITKRLVDYVGQYDFNGNAKITIGSNYMPWENAQKCADIVKTAGYNYGEKYYKKHHKEHPDWVIYGSETSSIVQSRGIYHFPFEKSILADDDEQCSALGNSPTSWGAKSTEACIIAERDTPFSMGQFIWSGFDYIGEPTPYHTKNSYFGQIDTATFKKDSYYIYQAEWTDYRTRPMIHVFPYWDFNKGQIIDVRVCSNAPKVELQLNGRTIGTHEIDHEHGTQLIGWWKVPYEEGELRAIAFDENGRTIATDIKRSFKDPKSIHLHPDKDILVANGKDLIFMEITMKDEHGNTVENANNRVQVHVSGAGRLVGLDNGDSTDYDQYKGINRRLFSGRLMAIIGATLEPGKIKVDVSSKGMKSETVQFISVSNAIEALSGISANEKNEELPCVTGNFEEIPLRKIEIVCEDASIVLNSTRKEMLLSAKLYPENTSYSEVQWSAVDASGIPSNIAKVEPCGINAKVTALGDGEFYIRCTSNNGTSSTKLISQMSFQASGLGTAYKNPYEFISAGLFDYSKGEVGNGNERGVSTARDGETQVGFHGIDFGPYGSDTITIPIFALTNEKYNIQIWEGMPDEDGGTLLDKVVYQKESKWNVYQEETYKLPKRLKGITALCFVLNKKVHIKGFSFEKKNRAYEINYAAQCDYIYGDSYTLKENYVEGIGNNVSLEFREMEFNKGGTTKLVICGKAPVDNTIIIKFSGIEGESTQLVEFASLDDYQSRMFEINRVEGLKKVTFIFLPGSNFDFGWFRFEP